MYKALALSLLTVLTLSSCAQEESPAKASAAYTIPVESLAEGQKIAQNAILNCDANCSPSVGLLAFATPEVAGQCTAFLISSDTIATNSHCIPEDLKEPGASCKNRIWMHFAKNGSQETRIACDQIIYDSKNYSGITSDPDYAYVKLAEASSRPALRITRDGFPDGSAVSIQKVNPVKKAGRMKGVQENVSCRTVQNSSVLESFFYDLAPVAMVIDCQLIHGNSGSPVLAKDGSVRGVAFAFQDKTDFTDVFAKNQDLKPKEEIMNLNFVANFACLRGANSSDRIPPACAAHASNLRKHLAQRGLEETQKVAADIEKQMAAMPSLADFGWTARFEKSKIKTSLAYAGVEASPVPKCVKAAAVARYANTVALDLPHWRVQEQYDRYLRSAVTLGPRTVAKTNTKVFPVDAGEYTVLLSGANFVQKIENVPICR